MVVVLAASPLRASADASFHSAGPGQPPPLLSQGGNNNTYSASATAGDAKHGNANGAGSPPSTTKPRLPSNSPNNPTSSSTNNATPAPCGWNPQPKVNIASGATGSGGANPIACPVPPAPPLTPATSPPPNLDRYYAQIFEEIRTSPGTVSAAPNNHTGLVNLPACFWLTDQAVPDQKQVSAVLNGRPNSAGKQIAYHITLTVTLESTAWSFGDGSTTRMPAPTTCVGLSGAPRA